MLWLSAAVVSATDRGYEAVNKGEWPRQASADVQRRQLVCLRHLRGLCAEEGDATGAQADHGAGKSERLIHNIGPETER